MHTFSHPENNLEAGCQQNISTAILLYHLSTSLALVSLPRGPHIYSSSTLTLNRTMKHLRQEMVILYSE